VAYPGGCDIGIRPIDLHLKGLKALNVKITEKDGFIVCDGRDMAGGIVHLDSPSVGATENIMLAAVRAKGATRIINPAKEPEIADLQNFINALGGKVSGAGTGSIYIEGADSLSGVEYTPIPDRIAAGTYITACGICSGKIKLTNVVPDHIYSLITKLREANINITIDKNEITADCARRPQSVQIIETAPHPGFATDLQAQTAALQTISDGTSMIIENIFESRYKYVPELIKMGANITVRDRMAIIRGVSTLHGGDVTAKDLRGGAALVLAGLAADGTTAVDGVHHIDRGYYKLERTLSLLGADIVRTY
jgi:UDP-N-acetylglucosamine 1-carboxyvinyltransferase